MPNGREITKKQRAVMDDLFAGAMDEQQVLERHRVSRRVFEKWQADEFFLREFEFRLQSQRRQGEMIIARYAAVAAAKLVQLTESQNPETARKACLDIINLLRPNAGPKPLAETDEGPAAELPPELASRLLESLANNDGAAPDSNCRPTSGTRQVK